jgi:hypothetical protein
MSNVNEEIIQNTYDQYIKVANYVGIPDQDRYTIEEISYLINNITVKIRSIMKHLCYIDCYWLPNEFSTCCNCFGNNEEYSIDIVAYVSDINGMDNKIFNDDEFGISLEFLVDSNKDLPEWLFEDDESEEDRINRLIYGDPEDDDDKEDWQR